MIQKIWTFFFLIICYLSRAPFLQKRRIISRLFIHLPAINEVQIVEIPSTLRVSKSPHAYVLLCVAHLQNNEPCNDVKGLMDSLLFVLYPARCYLCNAIFLRVWFLQGNEQARAGLWMAVHVRDQGSPS